jgi:hypothetical protein
VYLFVTINSSYLLLFMYMNAQPGICRILEPYQVFTKHSDRLKRNS